MMRSAVIINTPVDTDTATSQHRVLVHVKRTLFIAFLNVEKEV